MNSGGDTRGVHFSLLGGCISYLFVHVEKMHVPSGGAQSLEIVVLDGNYKYT